MKRELVIVRIPKRLAKTWITKHERDGIDEYKLSIFLEVQYMLGNYERVQENLLLFIMRFQKPRGKPMKAKLWVRIRKINSITELILVRGHVEAIKS